MHSVTAALAERVLATRWRDLPHGVRGAARSIVFDAVPVMAAGSREEAARIAHRFAAAMGGRPHCTVIGGGFSTSAPMAAFVNGVAGHVLDYEPMWHPPTHPTSPVLPVVLALVEWRGRDGADMLTALVAGFEVQARLLLAVPGAGSGLHLPGAAAGLHPPGVVGVMGAAAAASWLLGLDVQQTCMAFGIAASRAGGLMANIGTMTKSSHCGHAGRMGLEAALLAAEGFTANTDILAAPQGFGEVFLGRDAAADIASSFGRPFRIYDPGVAIKKYPSQYGTQRAIDAALAIAHTHRPLAEEIVSVTITGPQMDYIDRPRPLSGLDGKFSFQYVTAVALLDGKVGIDSFTDARRRADDVEALLPRIAYVARPDIPPNFNDMWIRTSVTLRDGRELSAECRRPTGLWGIPLTEEERMLKAQDCLSRTLSDGDATRVMEMVRRFGECSASDVCGLLRLLRGRRTRQRSDAQLRPHGGRDRRH